MHEIGQTIAFSRSDISIVKKANLHEKHSFRITHLSRTISSSKVH